MYYYVDDTNWTSNDVWDINLIVDEISNELVSS
jgi:hypothetical protein